MPADRAKTLRFPVTITASRAAVWHVLLDDALFRQWAAGFAEGSYYEGDWSEGTIVEGVPSSFLL